MDFEPFEMERYQSIWENIVEYNLSESGVHPLKIHEFVTKEQLDEILQTSLGYNQTNGTEQLRALIAGIYPGAKIENVLVTTGSAEANFLTTLRLINPADQIAIMLPNYMQIPGIARSLGANVKFFHLIPKNSRWEIEWDEFEKAISPKTKLIAVCTPNNPTGAQLQEEDMKKICQAAERSGAWVLSDEVYRGAERVGDISPTFWGTYDRVIVTGGISKAYGLPGLRIGWILAPPKLVNELWSYHDYTTICANPISDRLAQIALQPDNRRKIINRSRKIIRSNFGILQNWMERHPGAFTCIPPVAGAITLLEHHLNISSNQLTLKLRDEKSVLIVPGEQFLMDKYLRIGFGCHAEKLTEALNRFSQLIEKI